MQLFDHGWEQCSSKCMSDQYLVPFDGSFRMKDAAQQPPADAEKKKELKKELEDLVEELDELQRVFYADDRYSLLLVFQAMDAAGKDGTIRAVLSGVNPQGCNVSSFKQPSKTELEHDFLWRTAQKLPERGKIGVFNRSYYEETLVVRVHPEYLQKQRIQQAEDMDTFWDWRFDSIRDHEKHLRRNNTVVLKFFLNVSKEEQKQRFLERIQNQEKNWKFSNSDLNERGYWDDYMNAYEEMLNGTSRENAPWYAIPADDKPYMRVQVATIIRDTLKSLDLKYPEISEKALEKFDGYEQSLLAEE